MGKRYRRSSTVESPACAKSAARRGPTPFRNCSGVASASVVIKRDSASEHHVWRSDRNCTELPAILQARRHSWCSLAWRRIGLRVDHMILELDRLIECDPHHVMQHAVLAERRDDGARNAALDRRGRKTADEVQCHGAAWARLGRTLDEQ